MRKGALARRPRALDACDATRASRSPRVLRAQSLGMYFDDAEPYQAVLALCTVRAGARQQGPRASAGTLVSADATV